MENLLNLINIMKLTDTEILNLYSHFTSPFICSMGYLHNISLKYLDRMILSKNFLKKLETRTVKK